MKDEFNEFLSKYPGFAEAQFDVSYEPHDICQIIAPNEEEARKLFAWIFNKTFDKQKIDC